MNDEIIKKAYDFASEAFEKFPNTISNISIFGSVARGEENYNDIDILILIDDLNNILTEAFVDEYRKSLEDIANKYEKFHITTTRLSKFWNLVINGDPVMINIVRECIILYDTKVMAMFKRLLYQGMLKPTPEAIANQLNKAKIELDSVKNKAITNLVDLYWALIDSLQALIMYYGKLPPDPANLAKTLEELRKEHKNFIISKEDIEFYNTVYDLTKRVMHRQKRWIEHTLIQEIQEKTENIINKIEKLFTQ
ncbi:MAG: nucleotidyltransferase domain-containing protein [Candidatus Woesearchaeota archaeon]